MTKKSMPPVPPEAKSFCFMCGRPDSEVERMIYGPGGANICSDCVKACNQVLRDESSRETISSLGRVPLPQEIKAFLDEYVIGQELAKKTLSVAVYNHYKRILHQGRSGFDEIEVDKSNILLIGPTGTGKTLLAQILAKMLHVPFAIADATVLTEAGYVGEDVENILVRLLQSANYDVTRCEQGIIYIDELDKISRKTANPSITRDVSGEGVQQALLKILEGTVSYVPPRGGRKHPEANMIAINTRNILFICGGAFDGLDKVIQRRLGKNVVGFGSNPQTAVSAATDAILEQVEPEDLLQYGLIPELIGRLPVVVPLQSLDAAALRTILTQPRNALLKQYAKLLEMENVTLTFAPEAIDAMVERALKRGTGARALRSVIERTMMDIMYRLPSLEHIQGLEITPELVRGEMNVADFLAAQVRRKSA